MVIVKLVLLVNSNIQSRRYLIPKTTFGILTNCPFGRGLSSTPKLKEFGLNAAIGLNSSLFAFLGKPICERSYVGVLGKSGNVGTSAPINGIVRFDRGVNDSTKWKVE